jgi:hypothetical protein
VFLLVTAALLATGLVASTALLPDRSALERAFVGVLLACAAAIGLVEVLSVFGAIGRPGLITGSGILASFAVLAGGVPALALARRDLRAGAGLARRAATDPWLTAALAVATVSVGLALLAAWALPPWAWDGLGYHLPVSDDAIQSGTLRTVPTSVVYVNAYPHLGGVFATAFRLALGDDTFAESAQLPFALLAVLGIALAARREGVPTTRALTVALLFVAIPTVELQLAASYVDVMYAALVLSAFVLAGGPLDARTIGLAGLALGLALGTKPSAPPIVLAGLALLAVRGYRAGRLGEVLFAVGLTTLAGAWKYVENLAIHGNPIWPVELALGPVRLPGLTTMDALASMGLGEPLRSMSWVERLLDSWLSPFQSRHVYDMRLGGLGPLFTMGLLPVALAALVGAAGDGAFRRRLGSFALFAVPVALLSLASPGAYWARYTLALPGALLALAAVSTQGLDRSVQRAVDGTLIALGLLSVVSAAPGFTIDGPSVFAIAALPEDEREVAYGIDLDERPWRDLRDRVVEGSAFAYDPSFGLPGRLFAPHQRGRVEYLDERFPTPEALVSFVDRVGARAIVLGEGPDFGGADAARARPDRFEEVGRCAAALEAPCALFAVRPVESASEGPAAEATRPR